MARVFVILMVFAAVAAVALSIPRQNQDFNLNEIGDIPSELENEVVGIPTDAILKALEDAQGLNGRAATNLFNLSAYLDTNRPNGTALTFVPLITLITGLVQG